MSAQAAARLELWIARRLLRIIEETLAGLATKVPFFDQLPQQLRRIRPFALAVAILHRSIEDVEAAEIEKVERTHRPVQSLLHRGIDVLCARVAALEES